VNFEIALEWLKVPDLINRPTKTISRKWNAALGKNNDLKNVKRKKKTSSVKRQKAILEPKIKYL
jgi:hypothetical protein